MRSILVKKTKRMVFTVFVNFILVIVLSESAALAYYFYETGELFYEEHESYLSGQDQGGEGQGQLISGSLRHSLHPVLGYIRTPGAPVSEIFDRKRLARLMGSEKIPLWYSWNTNNYGFISEMDYPYIPAKNDQFVVGVFGGSVAQWFALQGAERLIKRLADIPELNGREIVVLNFGQGGYKQPQQLNALSYFLSIGQKFDYVINIDGFNELALTSLNFKTAIHPSMPSAQHILPILRLMEKSAIGLNELEYILGARKSKQKMQDLDVLIGGCHSAAMYYLYKSLRLVEENRYSEFISLLDNLKRAPQGTSDTYMNLTEIPHKEVFDEIRYALNLWVNSSLLMRNMLDGNEVPYLHVVQANQYFSNRKFTKEEEKYAISLKSPYRKAIEKGYPRLLKRKSELVGRGVYLASAVDLFDHVSESIYSDSCCHYNQLGNELMADFVAQKMAEQLKYY